MRIGPDSNEPTARDLRLAGWAFFIVAGVCVAGYFVIPEQSPAAWLRYFGLAIAGVCLLRGGLCMVKARKT
jgi:hypothetical protein